MDEFMRELNSIQQTIGALNGRFSLLMSRQVGNLDLPEGNPMCDPSTRIDAMGNLTTMLKAEVDTYRHLMSRLEAFI